VPNDVIVEGSADEKSMAQYSLNFPSQLKQDAEKWAEKQGVSLNEFILWAVAEKVGSLKEQLNEQTFPNIIYRRGVSGQLLPILRGTNLRVQTVVVAAHQWGLSPNEIAAEYGLSEAQVNEALAFYAAHRSEIDAAIAAEQTLEAANV
jgi:uncharacterized protein (DUF433 family)